MLATAFPDQHSELQEMVAEGDRLVVRWRMTGTHLGELAGPTMTVPPTGKRLDIWGMSMYRIEEGDGPRDLGELRHGRVLEAAWRPPLTAAIRGTSPTKAAR